MRKDGQVDFNSSCTAGMLSCLKRRHSRAGNRSAFTVIKQVQYRFETQGLFARLCVKGH
jgi:hypothetical protein